VAAQAVDLSKYKASGKIADVPPLSEDDEARVEALAEAHPEDAPELGNRVHTAFLVLVMPGGEIAAASLDTTVVLDRPPSTTDIYSACSVILRDIAAMQTAQQTQALQLQTARAFAQQQQAQQLMSKLPPDLKSRR
jgi:hypothetical protein